MDIVITAATQGGGISGPKKEVGTEARDQIQSEYPEARTLFQIFANRTDEINKSGCTASVLARGESRKSHSSHATQQDTSAHIYAFQGAT
jgi:hypothetical protein